MFDIFAIVAGVLLVLGTAALVLRRAARRRAASWSRISSLPGYSAPAFSRRIVDDGREPDLVTGVPMETDAELRDRISQALWDGHIHEAKQLSRKLRRNEGSDR